MHIPTYSEILLLYAILAYIMDGHMHAQKARPIKSLNEAHAHNIVSTSEIQ